MHVGEKSGREKIVFGGVVSGEHYTIIWKNAERMIDIHITYDNPVRQKEKLFEISFFSMSRILVQLKKVEGIYKECFSGSVTTMKKLEKRNKEWLLHPIAGFGEELSEWMELKERKMRVRKNSRNHVKATFLFPAEAAFYQNCHWWVCDSAYRWKGCMYQKEPNGSELEFIYVNKARYDRFRREMRRIVKNILQNVQYYSKYNLF